MRLNEKFTESILRTKQLQIFKQNSVNTYNLKANNKLNGFLQFGGEN